MRTNSCHRGALHRLADDAVVLLGSTPMRVAAQASKPAPRLTERQTGFHRSLGPPPRRRYHQERGWRLRGRDPRLQEYRVWRTVVHAGGEGGMGQEQQADDVRLRIALPAVGLRPLLQHAVPARLRPSPRSSGHSVGAGQPVSHGPDRRSRASGRSRAHRGWERRWGGGRATRSSFKRPASTAERGSIPRNTHTAMPCG